TSVEVKQNKRIDLGTFSLARSKGALQLASDPPGADFELQDAQQKTVRTGKTPATLRDLPTGRYAVTVRRGDWKMQDTVEIARNETTTKSFEFANGALAVTSDPSGA